MQVMSVKKARAAERKARDRRELARMAATAASWDSSLAVILPHVQYGQYQSMVSTMQPLLRRLDPAGRTGEGRDRTFSAGLDEADPRLR